jgi:dihydropteroate synthase
MIEEGASILDIGGMSTRPGALEIDIKEELNRVIPAIEAVKASFPDCIISIDTYRSSVAKKAMESGAVLVNDISGGSLDAEMIDFIAEHHLPYILMHMKGKPSDMQSFTDYHDLIGEILEYFVNKLRILHHRGIHDVVIDPGFGFSKTMDQNFQIINQLNVFKILECPIMIGLSRKSSLSHAIGRPVEDTLNATTALHVMALQQGASILRVHDVTPAMDAIKVFVKLQEAKNH